MDYYEYYKDWTKEELERELERIQRPIPYTQAFPNYEKIAVIKKLLSMPLSLLEKLFDAGIAEVPLPTKEEVEMQEFYERTRRC